MLCQPAPGVPHRVSSTLQRAAPRAGLRLGQICGVADLQPPALGSSVANLTASSRTNAASASSHSRHTAAAAAAASLALGLALQLASPGAGWASEAPAQARALTPYEEAARGIKYGPDADGRVRSCPTNINPNCVSTGSTNSSYGPAWRADETSPAAAAAVLEEVVAARVEGAELLKALSLAGGAEYRAWGVPSLFGQDVVEFVIRPDAPSDRAWEGDRPGGQLVTYRSMAGSTKYLWPISQPLGDFDAQRKRLALIRAGLPSWSVIGCELIECYQ